VSYRSFIWHLLRLPTVTSSRAKWGALTPLLGGVIIVHNTNLIVSKERHVVQKNSSKHRSPGYSPRDMSPTRRTGQCQSTRRCHTCCHDCDVVQPNSCHAERLKWVIPPDVGDAYVVKQADYTTCNNQQGTTATRNSCYSAHKGVSPADTIGGNCGDSYFYMSGSSGTSNRAYYYVSGFDNLPHEAISYNWEVDVNGPNSYSHSDRFAGGLDFRSSWETGTVSVPVSTSGYYYGSVYGLNSIAVLFTGGVCFSYGPQADSNVY